MTSLGNEVGIKIPLAEHFHSLQGEGRWCGLPMHFLRLPGCTVGKPQFRGGPLQLLPNQAEAKICTAFDGRNFFCDTDYAKHEEQELAVLLSETWERDICFTGGEPLMHENRTWYRSLHTAMRSEAKVHIETSGTIMPLLTYDWITVSPKKDWLPPVIDKAHQVKILIDEQTKSDDIRRIVHCMNSKALLYFSPIFDPNDFVPQNFQKCLELLREFARWRPQVSVQVHKFLGLR